jgi:hypothetical protein
MAGNDIAEPRKKETKGGEAAGRLGKTSSQRAAERERERGREEGIDKESEREKISTK